MKLTKLQAAKRFEKLLAKALREGMEEERKRRAEEFRRRSYTSRKKMRKLEKGLLKLKEEKRNGRSRVV